MANTKITADNLAANAVNASSIADGVITPAKIASGDFYFDTNTLYVDSANNRVGVGTASPSTNLDINVVGGMARVGGAAGNNVFQTYTGSVGAGIWAGGQTRLYSTGSMTLSTGATLTTSAPTGYIDAVIINSLGRVGIGEASTGANLHVIGESSSNSTNDFGMLDIEDGSDNGLSLGFDTTHNRAFLFSRTRGTDSRPIIINNALTVTRASEGYVGIGNASPAATLDVKGSTGTEVIAARFRKGNYADTGGHTTFIGFGCESSTWSKSGIGHQRTSSYDVGDLIFCVNSNAGGGTDVSTSDERMRILSSGALCVGRTSSVTSSSVAAAFQTSAADGIPTLDIAKVSGTTSSSARFINFHASSGGTAMGAIAGNGAANVQFVAWSDKRLKENIQPLSGSLDKVLALNPVSYDWKEHGEHIEAGFVAQEVEQILPEYVTTEDDENKTKGLTGGMTAGYIAVLTKAIQEQQTIIDDLKARIETLENA